MSLITDHEANIEAVAAADGPYVLQSQFEQLEAGEGALRDALRFAGKAVPTLASAWPDTPEDIPATPGSMQTHPVFSKSRLDVYRANAVLLRAALA